MKERVFISCPNAEKATADDIVTTLERSGVPCWYAPRDITSGAVWGEQIVDAIRSSRAFLLVMAEETNDSAQIKREVRLAVEESKPIVAILVEDTEPRSDLAYYLGMTSFIDATKGPVDQAVARVAQIVDGLTDSSVDDRSARNRSRSKVFISYRRSDGAETARLMEQDLRRRGFKPFLDVEGLRSGRFDEALLEEIDRSGGFLVVLTPGSLDRCSDPADWMRREIERALDGEKSLVPVAMPGFEYPPTGTLPPEIAALVQHQSVPYSHEFFDATMARVVEFLRRPFNETEGAAGPEIMTQGGMTLDDILTTRREHSASRRRARGGWFAAFLGGVVALVLIAVVAYLRPFPESPERLELLDISSTEVAFELRAVDGAVRYEVATIATNGPKAQTREIPSIPATCKLVIGRLEPGAQYELQVTAFDLEGTPLDQASRSITMLESTGSVSHFDTCPGG